MYKVSETVLPIYINVQCPIIKTCSDVTLNLSSKEVKVKVKVKIILFLWYTLYTARDSTYSIHIT